MIRNAIAKITTAVTSKIPIVAMMISSIDNPLKMWLGNTNSLSAIIYYFVMCGDGKAKLWIR